MHFYPLDMSCNNFFQDVLELITSGCNMAIHLFALLSYRWWKHLLKKTNIHAVYVKSNEESKLSIAVNLGYASGDYNL